MQVQLDLDLFTGGTDLVVPMQYYAAKYLDDNGLMKKRFAVSVDSRDELRKGALIRTSTVVKRSSQNDYWSVILIVNITEN